MKESYIRKIKAMGGQEVKIANFTYPPAYNKEYSSKFEKLIKYKNKFIVIWSCNNIRYAVEVEDRIGEFDYAAREYNTDMDKIYFNTNGCGIIEMIIDKNNLVLKENAEHEHVIMQNDLIYCSSVLFKTLYADIKNRKVSSNTFIYVYEEDVVYRTTGIIMTGDWDKIVINRDTVILYDNDFGTRTHKIEPADIDKSELGIYKLELLEV